MRSCLGRIVTGAAVLLLFQGIVTGASDALAIPVIVAAVAFILWRVRGLQAPTSL